MVARNIIARAVEVFLLITNVSVSLLSTMSLFSYALRLYIVVPQRQLQRAGGVSKDRGNELSPRMKLSNMFFRCSMSYSSAISRSLDIAIRGTLI